MNRILAEAAVKRFKEGDSCSQAILVTYGKQYGMEEKDARTIARCFGGGMGRTGQTCGAVTGAFMVLGLCNANDNDKLAKEQTYAQIQEFTQKFKAKHADVNCRQLIGCDLATAEGQEYFRNNNLIHKCCGLVEDAALILEEITGLDRKNDIK